MFVRVKKKPNGKKAIQIVESYRRADKVQQRIIRHLGQAVTDREVQELKALAESIIAEMKQARQPQLPLFSPEQLRRKAEKQPACEDKVKLSDLREEQRIIDGIGDVFGALYDELGFSRALGARRQDERWNAVLKEVVLARLANPVSKRRTASLLERDFGVRIPLEKIYRMMDRLSEREQEVKRLVGEKTLSLFEEVDVLFFDVTTLYFESFEADGLRENGRSKDGKFNETQVVLALVTTREGMPVTYGLYPGNTWEGNTLIEVVEEIRGRYKVRQAVLVADRGMFSEQNLAKLEALGVNYVVGAKLRSLPGSLKRQILDMEYQTEVVENELQWLREFEYHGRRLLCSYSAKRAAKDAWDRKRRVERLLKRQKAGQLSLKALLPNYGAKKYIKIQGGRAALDQDRIEADAQWDGIYGVITNSEKSAAELLSRYRHLWQIEETFRLTKHDLRMRPIHHWSEKRIRAHILLCFLALAVARHATYRYSRQQEPISFEQLREELLHAQSSLLVDTRTGRRYLLPSKVTVKQRKIYRAFGLTRRESAIRLA